MKKLFIVAFVCLIISDFTLSKEYQIIDLSVPVGFRWCDARAINENGQIVGICYRDVGWTNACVWDKEGNAKTLEGSTTPFSIPYMANSINDLGQIVGQAYIPNKGIHAYFLDTNNLISDLGSLGFPFSMAKDINNGGEVVGYVEDNSDNGMSKAFYWSSKAGIINIGSFGGDYNIATSINDLGQVVGYSNFRDDEWRVHPFIWSLETGMIDIGVFNDSPPDAQGFAEAINIQSQVVGAIHSRQSKRHAFIWEPTNGVVDLGTLNNNDESFALSINDLGEVIGWSCCWSGNKYFYWTKETGMVELKLDTLGGTKYGIRSINNKGEIVGWSETNDGPGYEHACLWIPQPLTHLHYYSPNTQNPLDSKWERMPADYSAFHPDWPTVVIVHGWNVYCNTSLNDPDKDGNRSWLLQIADEIYARRNGQVNLLAWDWLEAAKSTNGSCSILTLPEFLPFAEVFNQPMLLAKELKKLFGSVQPKYSQPIHLMGHSLGAYVAPLAAVELTRDYPKMDNDVFIPAQVTLWDPADVPIGNSYLTDAVKILRQSNVYVDLYAGITSLGDHWVNLWVNVPEINPFDWHDVYKWYQTTIAAGQDPALFIDENFTPYPHPENKPCTVGFGTSPLANQWRPQDYCADLYTLAFAHPLLWTSEKNFLNCGAWCRQLASATPAQTFPDEQTLTTLAKKDKGAVSYTLFNVMIDPLWDYLSFDYDFITAPQPAQLAFSILPAGPAEKRVFWTMSSDAALDFDWQVAGPFDIQSYHGRPVDLIFELTCEVAGAECKIKNIVFSTDANHSNQPPVANAGPDRAVLADNDATTTVVLDASATADPENDQLLYWWTQQNEFFADTRSVTVELTPGGHEFGLVVRDQFDYLINHISQDQVLIEVEKEFIRGEANNDSKINIADAIRVLDYLFGHKPHSCLDALDTNDDSAVNIADAVYLLAYLFANGPQPKAPFGTLGLDATPDYLGCN